MMKSAKSGFTLAEVLTTLMVIGVVAAMTIPTLMNSTQAQQARVAAKKAHSVLGQAMQLFVARELSCNITSEQGSAGESPQLAACMNQVIQGSVNNNTITTPDGMVMYFYSPKLAAGEQTLDVLCGEAVDGIHGKSNCGAVVDTNGTKKGTTAAPTVTFSDSGYTSVPSTDDIVAFALSATGASVAIGTGANAEKNKGYNLIYGQDYTESDVVTCYKYEKASDGNCTDKSTFVSGTTCGAATTPGFTYSSCDATK